MRCPIDHLDFLEDFCPACGLEVDSHGNTEEQFDYCSFPDCGCHGPGCPMGGERPFIEGD